MTPAFMRLVNYVTNIVAFSCTALKDEGLAKWVQDFSAGHMTLAAHDSYSEVGFWPSPFIETPLTKISMGLLLPMNIIIFTQTHG